MITTPNIKELEDLQKWLEDVPFEVIRYELYSAKDLYKGYEPSTDEAQDKASFAACYDTRTYKHYMEQGKNAMNVNESLARSLHDHSIYRSLLEFSETHDPNRCVGIMGGHAMLRTDPTIPRAVRERYRRFSRKQYTTTTSRTTCPVR